MWQTAITAGQHNHPGRCSGGYNPTWSQVTVRQGAAPDRARRCQRLGWIDLHTGLGPSGLGRAHLRLPRRCRGPAGCAGWWGHQVTLIYDGLVHLGTAHRHDGWPSTRCLQAEYTGIASVRHGADHRGARRPARDQWLENHPRWAAAAQPDKRRIRDAFCRRDTDAWKLRIVEQGHEAACRAWLDRRPGDGRLTLGARLPCWGRSPQRPPTEALQLGLGLPRIAGTPRRASRPRAARCWARGRPGTPGRRRHAEALASARIGPARLTRAATPSAKQRRGNSAPRSSLSATGRVRSKVDTGTPHRAVIATQQVHASGSGVR